MICLKRSVTKMNQLITKVIFTARVMWHGKTKTHEIMVKKYLKGVGIEIGAHQHPIPGIKPIYVDRYQNFAGLQDAVKIECYADACNLPFASNSLDYIATSHLIEHVANPVQALADWYRILRPGGSIYMVVPDKRYTFDHSRKVTSCEHLLIDFENNVKVNDLTHLDDQVDNADWSIWFPDVKTDRVTIEKEIYRTRLRQIGKSGGDVNIHHHVFDPASVMELIHALEGHPKTRFDWSVIETAERFPISSPTGVLFVLKVKTQDMHEGE
jgi:SAM-dependent methyltransferase